MAVPSRPSPRNKHYHHEGETYLIHHRRYGQISYIWRHYEAQALTLHRQFVAAQVSAHLQQKVMHDLK